MPRSTHYSTPAWGLCHEGATHMSTILDSQPITDLQCWAVRVHETCLSLRFAGFGLVSSVLLTCASMVSDSITTAGECSCPAEDQD